uniref:Uncharacterized protein n=1 Tax=Arion vulgaris TaxID=1028688 RepID=A0A0B7AJP6_9EUPU
MDIRKFFGGQSATKKAAEPIKNKNDTPKTKKEAPPRNDTRKNVKQSVGADSPNKKKKGASSPRKKIILEDEDAVIVDVSDEEVIKNSQTSLKGGKISQIKSESKSVISKVDKEAKSNKNVSIINNEKNEQHTTGVKKKYNTNTEDDGDFIEMLSVKSRDSSRSSSRNRKDSQRNGSKYKDNSKNNSAVETERNSSLSRSSKEKTSHGEAKRRKSRQKNQVSSDDEELDDDAIQVDESSDDEQEEVITSRKRPRKASSKKLKKAQRALDSGLGFLCDHVILVYLM